MVALRGRLIRGLPRGSMLSIRCSAAQIEKRLPQEIQLAASNAPALCVVSGPSDAIAAFGKELDGEGLIAPGAPHLACVPLGYDGSNRTRIRRRDASS